MAKNKSAAENDLTQARALIKKCRKNQDPYLDLGNCGITDLNDLPELFECRHLQTLILSNSWWGFEGNNKTESRNKGQKNKLDSIPSRIANLDNLTILIISGGFISKWGISDISFLANLTGLQSLSLSRNQISDFSFLEKLTGLKSVDLQSNNISEIPLSVFHLDMEINLEQYGGGDSGLRLHNNPIESPPMEIVRQGRQSMLDWFEATKIKLEEIKIILIGDPKAGKTSLLRRLKDGTFDENEVQTDGVNIEDIQFGKCDTFKKQTSIHKLTGHFWDFGGQEIMNATHQFFLTSRSVYILVLDAHKDANVAVQIRQGKTI